MTQPLPLREIYPAGVNGISTRMMSLSSGVTVRIAEAGPATGVPVVMLHGWGASLYMFRHGLTVLPTYGARAIAADLRGYGLSDKPRTSSAYTLDAYCRDASALLDALALPRAILIGQSMGGGLALRYALRHPARVARLVLINPSGLVSLRYLLLSRLVPTRAIDAVGRRLVPRGMIAFILRHLAYADPSRVTERDIDEYWAPTQLAGYVHAARAALGEFDWRPLTAAESDALTPPTLVILGEQDRLVRNASDAAKRLHGAQVITLPGGHCVHEEHPDDVYPRIGAFIREG